MKRTGPFLLGLAILFAFVCFASTSALFATDLSALEQTDPLPPESLPATGTFYSAKNPNAPPMPSNPFGLPAWDLGNGQYLLDDLNTSQSGFAMQATDDSSPPFIPGASGGDTNANYGAGYTLDTNGLYLLITNVTTDLAFVGLYNATNEIYAIWSTTNLLTPWNVETEVWPTGSNVMPFTVPTLARSNLFLMAEDWTGVTQNGNTTPDWWFFYYFGQAAFPNGSLGLSDTNLDSTGNNTLLYDYQNSIDPNQIIFSIPEYGLVTNSSAVSVDVAIAAGVPAFYAVLVDSTNFSSDSANATWIPYVSGNIPVNLGSEGAHSIWIGLRGLPDNAEKTWAATEITLDTTPPLIKITSPASSVVSSPILQIQGLANKDLRNVSCDISNASGSLANGEGYVTARFYSNNLLVATNCSFQCYDVPLIEGSNSVTVHVTDLAGNQSSTNLNLTVDYSGDTTAPTLTIMWPQDGTKISGSSFTLQAQVDDITAQVMASANGSSVQGQVQRNGQVRGLTLPISAGTNAITVISTDAAGNASTNNFNVIQSTLTLTVNPVSNLGNQTNVTVKGAVGDPTEIVMINGVQAVVGSDGTWTANNVPVNSTGMATINAQAYPSGSDPATSSSDGELQSYQQQPPLIRISSYSYSSFAYDNDNLSTSTWTNGVGGVYINVAGGGETSNNLSSNYWAGYVAPWIYENIYSSDGSFAYQNPAIVIDAAGEGQVGTTNTYAVSAWIEDLNGSGLPPEQFEIQGQMLGNTGITNQDGAFGG